MKRFLALLAALAVIAGGVAFRLLVWDSPGKDPIRFQVVCANEIGEFCVSSIEGFAATDPAVDGRPVQVELTSGDSVETAAEIVDQTIRPLVWIPASMAYVDEANAQYADRNSAQLFFESGEYQVLPIAISPTVFVMPSDRAGVLRTHCGGTIDWDCIHAAVTGPGWREITGADPNWGLVKFGYADPTTTDTGLGSLILQTYGYYRRPNDLTPADVTDPAYVDWVRGIAASVTSFAQTNDIWVRDLVIFCPGAYDIATTYEFVAATSIDNAAGRGCDLEVIYPEINNRSDFPFAILVTPDSTAEDKDAALALRNYMYGAENQAKALDFGLRPANPDVAVIGTTANPLADHVSDGISLEIPRSAIADHPSFETLTNLLLTWKQKVEP